MSNMERDRASWGKSFCAGHAWSWMRSLRCQLPISCAMKRLQRRSGSLMTTRAPRLQASRPICPEQEKRSRKYLPWRVSPREENTAFFTKSDVTRALPCFLLLKGMRRPLNSPAMMRIRAGFNSHTGSALRVRRSCH